MIDTNASQEKRATVNIGAFVKHNAQRFSPKLYHYLRWRIGKPARYTSIKKSILAKFGNKVLGGPFVGMSYVEQAAGSAYVPKLLGSYEEELHAVVHQTFENNYSVIVDIGCAEGYYAVGYALAYPKAQIYAFDSNPEAQKLCQRLSVINDVVNRVHIHGHCDIEILNTLPMTKALVICDCEGYETELLQPELLPELCTCDILVETHDAFVSDATETICGRFTKTHEIQLIDITIRNPKHYPAIANLPVNDQELVLSEGRPAHQQWAFMRVKDCATD